MQTARSSGFYTSDGQDQGFKNLKYAGIDGPGVIGGAEMILIPEIETPLQDVVDAVSQAYARGKTHAIILVAEGFKFRTDEVAQYVEEQSPFQTRVTILGHVQRGGRPSAFDR